MLSARRNLECGLLSPTAFRAAETSRRLQNLELSRCQDLEQSHSSGVNCLSLDPMCRNDKDAVCRRNEAHRFAVSTVQWYPCDTGLFTSSGMDSELRVWDANALKVAEVLRLGAKVYSHHLEEAQPTIVALGTGRPWVTLADLRTGIACQELRGHSGKVLAVRWSPSVGGLLATASQDNKVMLWDIRCARGALAALKGHSGAATSLAFLPDGLVLFSLGADNRLRAWDIARRRELHFFGAIVPNEVLVWDHKRSSEHVHVRPDRTGDSGCEHIGACNQRSVSLWNHDSSRMHYRLLEENVNQWKLELEEHEATFVNQATQVNAWDRLLLANGEKIGELSDLVDRVKLDQQRLDHELDFIAAQQGELQELLEPLERGIQATPGLSVQQHADLEREHTYHLAENVNAQLRCMSQDIKDIIQQLNAANAAVAQDKPLNQVSKVLNAHMDALSWVQHNSGLLQKQLQELERACQQQRGNMDQLVRR
ncbi:hypothetical protein HPB47_010285 [Ixodes persulcatus]|uniref:Uncharacterized protein n=1 Tax=Ixodes persulcatus TaxID=34615 RepID=A0AC60NZR3_IXOPE|nr:hypothetical protein HPB47_010285 [Ixodes persulcatus]